MHVAVALWFVLSENLQAMPVLGNVVNFAVAVGVLFVFMTICEVILEDGLFSGLICFFAIPIPVVGSVILFKFLVKMVRKENGENRKAI